MIELIYEFIFFRLKVINIDKNCFKIVKLENVYKINEELCRHHAFAMKCCLLEVNKYFLGYILSYISSTVIIAFGNFQDETAKQYWNAELGSLFTTTLKECELSVTVLKEIHSFPPKFVVEIFGFNKSINAVSNIGGWVNVILIPEIVQLGLNGETEDLIQCMTDDALEPYGNKWHELVENDSVAKNKNVNLNSCHKSAPKLSLNLEQISFLKNLKAEDSHNSDNHLNEFNNYGQTHGNECKPTFIPKQKKKLMVSNMPDKSIRSCEGPSPLAKSEMNSCMSSGSNLNLLVPKLETGKTFIYLELIPFNPNKFKN